MSIQEISITNNQKKQLIRTINDESILIIDDNEDLVVNVENYKNFIASSDVSPIEDIITDETLNWDAEFIIFS